MLYIIDNECYILVGNKYVKVDFDVNNNDVTLIPNRKEYKERNVNLKVKQQPFDNKFKEKIKKKQSKSSDEGKRNEENYNGIRKNRYNR